MELQGKIIQVLPLESGVGKASQKEWKKQNYVLETLDIQYPKKVCFNLWGENIDKFALREGEDVTVQFDLESREFNGRWYTDVRAYRVDRGLVSLASLQAQAPQASAYSSPIPPSTPTVNLAQPIGGASFLDNQPADDLPF